MNPRLERIVIERKTKISGLFRKIGLDSCVIVDMIEYMEMLSYVSKLFQEPDLLYTHEICVRETISILCTKKNYSKEQSEKLVNDFLTNNNIKIIKSDKNNPLYRTINIHKPDCFIIADWKKNNINIAYSQNNHFIDACRSIGISAIKIPTFDSVMERRLKDLFKLNKKR